MPPLVAWLVGHTLYLQSEGKILAGRGNFIRSLREFYSQFKGREVWLNYLVSTCCRILKFFQTSSEFFRQLFVVN